MMYSYVSIEIIIPQPLTFRTSEGTKYTSILYFHPSNYYSLCVSPILFRPFSLQSTPYLLPVYSPYHFCLLNSLSCLLPISIESTPQIWEYPVLYTELECNEQLSTIKTYILAFGFVLKKPDESNEQFSTIKTVILASGFVHKFVMYTFLDW